MNDMRLWFRLWRWRLDDIQRDALRQGRRASVAGSRLAALELSDMYGEWLATHTG